MISLVQHVRQLTAKYDSCPLECDGLTRVLHTVLTNHGIPHQTVLGTIQLGEQMFEPHFWIKLPNSYIVDYRARMWLGPEAPHGVFRRSNAKYAGRPIRLEILPDFLFKILALGC